jgi:hypothetical protein
MLGRAADGTGSGISGVEPLGSGATVFLDKLVQLLTRYIQLVALIMCSSPQIPEKNIRKVIKTRNRTKRDFTATVA